MFYLNIAEKPSVAKSISYTLCSSATKSTSPNKYTPNYTFTYNNNKMLFTSLLGHLFTHDFIDHKDWQSSDPRKLLNEAEVKSFVNKGQETIKQNILYNAQYADTIVLWTDCDREGENIAMEVKELILEVYPNKTIKRAKFNAITYGNIVHALENLVDIDVNESNAVEARIELDLRLGSAFTRIQTINIKRDTVISYGPCQIPTLNFVVERMVRIDNFMPEKFFTLKLKVHKKMTDIFDWARGNLFDKNCVVHMYEKLMVSKYGIVIDVTSNPKEKARPLPLRTVELQKACASIFRISSHQVMQIAEGLYTKGFISYPRTETDVFPTNFNFKEIISKLSSDYPYCRSMEQIFQLPRRGQNNDMAHSPIYPLKSGSGLVNNDKKIFDYIARRFLGCISKNARGMEIHVRIKVGNEEFKLTGLQIIERNYLDIFTYDSWNEKKINDYILNEKVSLDGLEVSEGCTVPPELITEPELISLMDKNGIGTDATIAEHIQKIQDRTYVTKRGKYFVATNLGKGLIFGYNDLGLEYFVKPYLRCELEKQLKNICEGKICKSEVVRKEIDIYLHFYDIIANGIGRLRDKIKEFDRKDDSSSDSDIKPSKPTNKQHSKKYKGEQASLETNKKTNVIQNIKPGFRQKSYQTFAQDNSTILIDSTKARHGFNQKQNSKTLRTDQINQTDTHTVPLFDNKKKSKITLLPNCHCKIEAVKNVVTKESPNKGKQFFSCSRFPNGCDFFEWSEQKLLCYCNYEPQIKTAQTENNHGRQFYKCKKAHKPCKYFKWCDE